jgi:hypothetical protein
MIFFSFSISIKFDLCCGHQSGVRVNLSILIFVPNQYILFAADGDIFFSTYSFKISKYISNMKLGAPEINKKFFHESITSFNFWNEKR